MTICALFSNILPFVSETASHVSMETQKRKISKHVSSLWKYRPLFLFLATHTHTHVHAHNTHIHIHTHTYTHMTTPDRSWPHLWIFSSSHHLCPWCKSSNTYIWGIFICTSFQTEGPHEFFSFSFMWDHRALQRLKLCYWQRSLRPEGFSPPASVTKRFQD